MVPKTLPKLSRTLLSFALATLAASAAHGQTAAAPLVLEHGTYGIHSLLHRIGTEEYTISGSPTHKTLRTVATLSDRGTKRDTVTTLELGPAESPLRLEQRASTSTSETTSTTEFTGRSATMHEGPLTRTVPSPPVAFVGMGNMPAAVEMILMRYWKIHHQPARLAILRADPRALPLEIREVGHEVYSARSFTNASHMVRLTRYTVANLVFGREVVWMDDSYRLAAVMTFAGGLPQEEILDEYEPVSDQLFRSGVSQEMLDLAALTRAVPPEAQGTFGIVGARLIDGTGASPIENAAVLVRNGRIVSVKANATAIPAGTKVIHAEGKSLLPGLWEMHSHYSGVEFGPALLATGVTTARDCGGEFAFLVAVRKAIAQGQLGPRLLLAGLVDSGGPLGFGSFDVETPAEGIAAVDFYADAHFDQIKVYTQIKPDVLRAIAIEAHRRGLTVTGHVPAALSTSEAILDGQDQINHLQFVTRWLRPDPKGPVDLTAPSSRQFLELLKQHNTVVDPTAGWGEMAGHAKSIPVASFEPGISHAPFTLASKFENLGVPAADEAAFRERMATNLNVIDALYQNGIPIVAGSDTGLIGYGLIRELELYVQAGMTPMAAIQSATLVAARAMRLDADSGTIAPGKRADMILVDGNPLANISNLRKVTKVIADGRMYDSRKLHESVGFH
jgi:imidazolonepropionase-like amidohydrolase